MDERALMASGRLLMTALVQLLLLVAVPLMTPAVAEKVVGAQRTAIALGSVTIDCYNLTTESHAAPRRVEWISHAWSPTHDPLTIFRSDSNPDFSVETGHPNAVNYAVDRQYRLTIINVNIEKDPGIYVCRIVDADTGHQHDHNYDLNVGERQTCEATATEVRPGGETTLTCNMSFSGNAPTVKGLNGV